MRLHSRSHKALALSLMLGAVVYQGKGDQNRPSPHAP